MAAGLHVVQLHGKESLEFAAGVCRPVCKVVHVVDEGTIFG